MVFTNLVDFDMLFGHRRDVTGYADALEAFDRFLPQLLAALRPGDLLALTADHGCDPTWPGSDHTRELVPLLFGGPACPVGRALGVRSSAVSPSLAMPEEEPNIARCAVRSGAPPGVSVALRRR